MKVCLLALPIICLGLGCQASYNVEVNGYSSTGQGLQIPHGSSITVVADSNAPNPILEREIRAKIETLLTEKGYAVKADREKYYLLFSYGIDSGRTVTGVVPVWHSGFYRGYPYRRGYGYRHDYITHVPYSEVVYTRWLVLRLFDGEAYKTSKKTEPLWIGEVTSAGMDSDLRELINYMLIVGFEYLGQDIGRMISEVISKDDERVWLLR
ncbi:MAG: hypothetical protein U9Q07_11480 [Planctomycetota bacterium]|nr:hypothetical protein [Planctomycetota bacterium]